MPKFYNVAIIDKKLISRLGLSTLINDLPDFKVVLNEDIRNIEISSLKHMDVILYSIQGLDLDTAHWLKQLVKVHPNLPIVVLLPNISREDQFNLIRLGVKAIIVEEASQLLLSQSLQCAAIGGSCYPNDLLSIVFKESRVPRHTHIVQEAFTERQKEIMQYLALGFTAQKIADQLFRSRRTIELHLHEAMKTAKVNSASQLLLFALEYGLIENPFRDQSIIFMPKLKNI